MRGLMTLPSGVTSNSTTTLPSAPRDWQAFGYCGANFTSGKSSVEPEIVPTVLSIGSGVPSKFINSRSPVGSSQVVLVGGGAFSGICGTSVLVMATSGGGSNVMGGKASRVLPWGGGVFWMTPAMKANKPNVTSAAAGKPKISLKMFTYTLPSKLGRSSRSD